MSFLPLGAPVAHSVDQSNQPIVNYLYAYDCMGRPVMIPTARSSLHSRALRVCLFLPLPLTVPVALTGHYPTSLALRDNRPEGQTGLSSLTVLRPNSPIHGHMRKSSFVSTLAGSDSDEPRQARQSAILSLPSHLRCTNITITAPSSPGRGGSCGDADASASGKHEEGQKSKSNTDTARGGRKEKEREERKWQIALGSDPGAALALARLVDPKSLHILEALGGRHAPRTVQSAVLEEGGARRWGRPKGMRRWHAPRVLQRGIGGTRVAHGQPVWAERAPHAREQEPAAAYVAKEDRGGVHKARTHVLSCAPP
ncbi:hypothetical protein DFH11DRAFT_1732830 [Phellopilus nigrolimitatus]|nr:hypothetical protein DFH11DRAFT_1732830 [Phellopilus nigrolimitatus]